MDQFIRLSGFGAPVSCVVGLIIVRLTNPDMITAKSQARTIERLLDMVNEIENNGAGLQAKDAAVIDLAKRAIPSKDAVEVDHDHEDDKPPPDDRPWWTRWIRCKR